jgi:hypothetical protein
MYSPPLLEYLHQVTPPPAKMPPTKDKVDKEENIEEEFDCSEVQAEATKNEE